VWSFSGGEVEVAPQFQPLEPGETELRIRKKSRLAPGMGGQWLSESGAHNQPERDGNSPSRHRALMWRSQEVVDADREPTHADARCVKDRVGDGAG
jgi:hypothetical protein